jgi:hypothetical protein
VSFFALRPEAERLIIEGRLVILPARLKARFHHQPDTGHRHKKTTKDRCALVGYRHKQEGKQNEAS